MKNLPKKIYLQIGDSVDRSTTDWNDLVQGAVTWADHRINDNDIEFVLSDVGGSLPIVVDRGDAEDFLIERGISNHPHIQDSVTGKKDFEVADLMVEFFNQFFRQ